MNNLKLSMLTATVIIIIMLSCFASCGFAQSSVFAPIWIEKGVFVELSFDKGLRASDNSSVYVTYENGTFSWECIELTGNTAKLKLTLKFNEIDGVTTMSGEALVDAVNRSVYSLDGNLLGTTQLWQESNPTSEVILWDTSQDKIFGEAETGRVGETPQGNQETFKVTGNGTINNNEAVFNARYDTDTGLMIRGLLWNEPTLKALKAGILNSVTISDTNIDLGPVTETFEFNLLIPILVIAGAFSCIFITVCWKRNKKRKAAAISNQ